MSDDLPPRRSATGPTAAKKSSKPGVSPARNIVGIVAFLALATVGFLEYRAWQQMTSAVEFLETQVPDEQDEGTGEVKELITVQDVENKIGEPSVAPVQTFKGEKRTYTWSGVFRTYNLYIYYSGGQPSGLIKYDTVDSESTS